MKRCSKCKEYKPTDEYEELIMKHGRTRRDGWCIQCREEQEQNEDYTTGAFFVEGLEKNVKNHSEKGDGYSGGKSTWGSELSNHSGRDF